MVYRQNVRAQTAITEIHSIHRDIVFDLSASCSPTGNAFLLLYETVQGSHFVCVFISAVISFELKIMCSERSGWRLLGSVAVITDLWSLSNLIMGI